ncbi:MAG: CPBP family intramembrane metalloprotease [Candidatus Hydrogenedentes bacterium]|nr:CPBP family intramembrane metalloprotease [Candidatus Hydrogenedentota bacterium]
MNLRTAKTIFFKELLDTLRDKRTLIAMLGVPVVLYPALFIFGAQAMVVQQDTLVKTPSRVVVQASDPQVVQWISGMPMIQLAEAKFPSESMFAGEIDAIIVAQGNTSAMLQLGTPAKIDIQYDATEPASREAQRRLSKGLEKHFERLLNERIAARGLPADFALPLKIGSKDIAPPAKSTGTILGMILPMIMVVMLGVGAFYPAIDITAGEKERGTFETLLSTPTTKLEIVFGKFLTIFLLSLLTGVLNLASLTLTFAFQLTQIQDSIGAFEIHLPAATVALIFLLMAPLAFFISAAMMSIAVLARNFKEAQNFVTPFFAVIMFPSMFASLPGVKLTAAMQLAPIANVALLFKDLMTGKSDVQSVFVVLVSTAVYAVLALLFAAWVFQREEVILSEDRGIPLTLRRSEFTPEPAPSMGLALFLFALVFILIFYLGTYVQSQNAISGTLITQWGIILAPTVVILWFVRVDIVRALSLRLPSFGASVATLLMALAWVVLILQISIWQNRVLPMPEEMARQMEELLQLDNPDVSIVLILFAFALSPAICEDALCRGALFSGLRRRMPDWVAVLAVAALFGLLHMVVYRVLTTAISGAVLGYIVWRSRSLYASIAAHFINNAVALLASTGQLPQSVGVLWTDERYQKSGLPVPALLGALAVFGAGVVLMEWTARRNRAA